MALQNIVITNMSDFPSKDNPQLCRNGCGAKIYLSKESGKYLPHNLDDSIHDCRDKDRPPKKEEHEPKLNNEAKLARVVLLVSDALKILQSMKHD